MKVNHYQIKNAIAHVSKQVEKDFPNKKHTLSHVNFDDVGNHWRFVIYDANPLGLPTGTTYDAPMNYVAPRYYAKLAEIGRDESVSLDNIFIETFGIGKVIDAGFGFMNHAEKITTATLIGIYNARLYMRRYPSWALRYSCLDKKRAEIEMDISVSNQGVIFDVELYYTKGEKAYELAENFIKQSNEILNPTKIHQYYQSRDKYIHFVWYKGFNQQAEPIELYLEVDAKNEIILSQKINIRKPKDK